MATIKGVYTTEIVAYPASDATLYSNQPSSQCVTQTYLNKKLSYRLENRAPCISFHHNMLLLRMRLVRPIWIFMYCSVCSVWHFRKIRDRITTASTRLALRAVARKSPPI